MKELGRNLLIEYALDDCVIKADELNIHSLDRNEIKLSLTSAVHTSCSVFESTGFRSSSFQSKRMDGGFKRIKI